MAWRLACILVGMTSFLTIPAAQEKGTAAKQEMAKLRGIWQVTKLIDSSENGGPAEELKEFTVEFQDGLVTIRKRKRDEARPEKFTLDPSKKPKWIDIGVDIDPPPIGQGIYKLEGDELTICMVTATDSEKPTPRPSEFKASKQGHSLLVLKKIKQ